MHTKMTHSASLLIFILFVGLSSEIFTQATSAQLSAKDKGNCTYQVTIETTCTKGADTSNHISLRFGDTNSNEILVRHLNSKHLRQLDPLYPQVLDDIPRKPFQACTVDQFQVTGQCVEANICYIYLKLNGNDNWRPGFVQVQVSEDSHLSSEYFHIRRYLPRHVWHGSDMCQTEVTPFGVRCKRKVLGKKHG